MSEHKFYQGKLVLEYLKQTHWREKTKGRGQYCSGCSCKHSIPTRIEAHLLWTDDSVCDASQSLMHYWRAIWLSGVIWGKAFIASTQFLFVIWLWFRSRSLLWGHPVDMPRICTPLGLPQLMVSSLLHAILATAAASVLMLLGSEARVRSYILLFSSPH